MTTDQFPGTSTRWPKGQSGNRNGRPKLKLLTDAIRDALQTEGPGGKLWLDIVVQKWLEMIFNGDVQALRELLNRLEGRSPLSVSLDARVRHESSEGEMIAIFQAFAPDCLQPDGRIILPAGLFAGTGAAVGVAIGSAVAEAVAEVLVDDQAEDLGVARRDPLGALSS